MDKGIAKRQTYIYLYSWHPDCTKTLVSKIPNKMKRSKYKDVEKTI